MKNFIFLFAVLFLGLTSCSDDKNSSGEPKQQYRHTLIVYMSAQNSLGNATCHFSDSTEIAVGTMYMRNPKDNIILYMDDADNTRVYRFYVNENQKAFWKKIYDYKQNMNSSDPETLKGLLSMVGREYPSSSYGLVLWSHGSGWLPDIPDFDKPTQRGLSTQGFSVDVGPGGDMGHDLEANGLYGMQMDIDGLASAIEGSGIHPKYIFFDACQMQCIEVGYALRNATDYIIASPATTSSYGIYYTHMIQDGFFADTWNDEAVSKMALTYYYDTQENPSTKNLYKNQGCIMSVVKTSAVEDVARMTATCLSKTIRNKEYPNVKGVQTYNDFLLNSLPNFCDMASAMKNILSPADFGMWKAQMDKYVVVHLATKKFLHTYANNKAYIEDCDVENTCGVSMFFPQKMYSDYQYYGDLNEMFKQTQWYKAGVWAGTGW